MFCGNNTVAVAMRFAMKMAKFAFHCGHSLRFCLRFKKSLAIAVAMPWCTLVGIVTFGIKAPLLQASLRSEMPAALLGIP